jgi:hypothetical protein
MSRYPNASEWLAGAARRNPEGILLLAAGCCLLLSRGRGSSLSRRRDDAFNRDQRASSDRIAPSASGAASDLREGFSRAAKSATGYAADIKDRVADTAGSSAASASEFAGAARRQFSEHSNRLGRQARSTLQDSMERVLREQPLAVVIAGLATGAAVAALFPSTEIEGRTLGGASEALTGAAGQMAMDAAGKAKEHLQAVAKSAD